MQHSMHMFDYWLYQMERLKNDDPLFWELARSFAKLAGIDCGYIRWEGDSDEL